MLWCPTLEMCCAVSMPRQSQSSSYFSKTHCIGDKQSRWFSRDCRLSRLTLVLRALIGCGQMEELIDQVLHIHTCPPPPSPMCGCMHELLTLTHTHTHTHTLGWDRPLTGCQDGGLETMGTTDSWTTPQPVEVALTEPSAPHRQSLG